MTASQSLQSLVVQDLLYCLDAVRFGFFPSGEVNSIRMFLMC